MHKIHGIGSLTTTSQVICLAVFRKKVGYADIIVYTIVTHLQDDRHLVDPF